MADMAVRVDPEIWTDPDFAMKCSMDARWAYFDSLFYLASTGTRQGHYPHSELENNLGDKADAAARQLIDLGVWEPSFASYWVNPYEGCRVVQLGRDHIPNPLRRAVYERDGHACLHCGSTESLSLDHIVPWSLGGKDTFENLQTLCRSCNSKKGARV